MARRRRVDDRMLLVPGETVRSRIGVYTVDTVIGSGSYSTVYSAKDTLGRKVALKEFVPARHPREAPHLQSLFERERFVLSLVSPHPLMPGFYDGFDAEGHFYLAQEFIEGKTLEEVIAATRIKNEWMLRWATSLCYALSYLHNMQIVHHDLKPANIKIRPNGRLALLDFGAARYLGPTNSSVPQSFTEDDDLYGTEGYLPPELDGGTSFSADVRTDIFALGCILYEMVMGEPPEQKLINERTSFITTPLMTRKDVNLDYVKIVTTALSYNTDYRYGSVEMFLDALRPISPPVFMVSTKLLAFGRTDLAAGAVQRKFTIFNGGSGGEFTGDVKSKAPWLSVEMPAFHGTRRGMVVTADPSKIKERNQVVHGTIEVWTAEKRDAENKRVSASETVQIDCTIMVTPTPARLEVIPKPGEDDPSPVLKIRKGLESTVSLDLYNAGESAAEIKMTVPDLPGLSVVPERYVAEPASTQRIVISVPAAVELKPESSVILRCKPAGSRPLEIPISVRSARLVDGIKGLFKRG